MEQRAPFHSKAIWLLVLLYLQCTGGKEQVPLLAYDMSRVQITTAGGITRVNNEIFTGTLFTLHSNGIDTAEIQSYYVGKPHGIWETFYANGKKASIRKFESGKKEGIYEAWWDNGVKKLEYHFEEDEYEGNCKEWTASGLLIKNMNYKKGYEEGRQQQWTSTGKIWANYEARNGRQYGLTGIKGCATLWKSDSVSSRH